MVQIAKKIKLEEVQLNTPLRPCAVEPLSAEEMKSIEKDFKDMDAEVIPVMGKGGRKRGVVKQGLSSTYAVL